MVQSSDRQTEMPCNRPVAPYGAKHQLDGSEQSVLIKAALEWRTAQPQTSRCDVALARQTTPGCCTLIKGSTPMVFFFFDLC